jgi:hypothetical protein
MISIMSIDLSIKKTVHNLKKEQRNVLMEAVKNGYLTSAMASGASGSPGPLYSAGQVATLTRMKEISGEPLFVRKGFVEFEERKLPKFTFNPEAKTTIDDLSPLLKIYKKADEL